MENANDTLFQEALTHFPGGVSSPVRAFRAVGGTPKFFRKAWGARFEDEEERCEEKEDEEGALPRVLREAQRHASPRALRSAIGPSKSQRRSARQSPALRSCASTWNTSGMMPMHTPLLSHRSQSTSIFIAARSPKHLDGYVVVPGHVLHIDALQAVPDHLVAGHEVEQLVGVIAETGT